MQHAITPQLDLGSVDQGGDQASALVFCVKCQGRAKVVRVPCAKAARREALAFASATGAFDAVFSRVLKWSGSKAETFGPVSITPMMVAL